jgi:RNA polymerase sigma factor (sigma-70 family)
VETRLESSEALVARLLPDVNDDPEDRAVAWEEWYVGRGTEAVLAYVRTVNDTPEPDAEILQEALTTAYLEIERGRYRPRKKIPFTAYIKGIARNKIREARRRGWRTIPLEEIPPSVLESYDHRMESVVERREQIKLLLDGMAKLSPCRRRVLEGYFSGQSTEEIAQALGMSEVSVRQHKSRGVRCLQRRLRQQVNGRRQRAVRPPTGGREWNGDHR